MTSVQSTRNPMAFLDEEVEELRAKGLYRRLRVVESEQAAHCRIDGKDVITLSSNNYLGLATHPKLREATVFATTFTMVEDWALAAGPEGTTLTKTWRDVRVPGNAPFPIEDAVRETAKGESSSLVERWNDAARATP